MKRVALLFTFVILAFAAIPVIRSLQNSMALSAAALPTTIFDHIKPLMSFRTDASTHPTTIVVTITPTAFEKASISLKGDDYSIVYDQDNSIELEAEGRPLQLNVVDAALDRMHLPELVLGTVASKTCWAYDSGSYSGYPISATSSSPTHPAFGAVILRKAAPNHSVINTLVSKHIAAVMTTASSC